MARFCLDWDDGNDSGTVQYQRGTHCGGGASALRLLDPLMLQVCRVDTDPTLPPTYTRIYAQKFAHATPRRGARWLLKTFHLCSRLVQNRDATFFEQVWQTLEQRHGPYTRSRIGCKSQLPNISQETLVPDDICTINFNFHFVMKRIVLVKNATSLCAKDVLGRNPSRNLLRCNMSEMILQLQLTLTVLGRLYAAKEQKK